MNQKKIKVTIENQVYDLTGLPTDQVVVVIQKALDLNDAIEQALEKKEELRVANLPAKPGKAKPKHISALEDDEFEDEDEIEDDDV